MYNIFNEVYRMKHKKSVKKNYIYNLLYQLLIILLPIITTPYIARKLGASGNGIYGYTISIVTYFMLFGSLGVNLYGQREVAYNQNNPEKRTKVLYELLILKTVTMIISGIVFYILFCRAGEYALYYKILILEMLASLIDISWFYQGMEDFQKIVIRNFVVKLISIVCIFIFIKQPSDIYKYLLIYVFSNLFGAITLWFGLKKYTVQVRKLKIVHHLPTVLALFIPQIAIQIYTVLDKTMLGVILQNMNEVGYYEQSQKIIKILLTVITAVGTVMLPRIANCFAENDKEKIRLYMARTFKFVFLLAFPLMFGIIAVSNSFAPLFFGKGYDKVPAIMSIMSMIVLFISLSNVTGTQFLLSTKREKEFTISVVTGAIINFIFNLILIGSLKSIGAAVATVIAELSVTLVQLYFVRKDFNLREIFKSSINYLIAGVLMLGLCWGIGLLIHNNLICLIVQVVSGIVIYAAVLILLKDKFLSELYTTNARPILKKLKLVK